MGRIREYRRLLREKALRRYEKHRRRNRFAESGVHDFVIVLDNLKQSFNIGKIFRSADAMGAAEVHLIGTDFFDPTVLYPDILPNRTESAGEIPGSQSSDLMFERAVMTFQKMLEVLWIKKSNLIEIRFRHQDPVVAADVVNKLSELYLDRHLQVHKNPQSGSFFKHQFELLKKSSWMHSRR